MKFIKQNKLKITSFYILIFCCAISSYCQNYHHLKNDTLLSTGILIKNLNVTIPWGIRYDSVPILLSNKGVYKFQPKGKYFVWAIDSAIIFKNIKTNIFFQWRGTPFQSENKGKFWAAKLLFKESDFDSLRIFLGDVTQQPDINYIPGKDYGRPYSLNNCLMKLFKSSKHKIMELDIQWHGLFNKRKEYSE
jgi:hypothetical protein